MSDVRFEQQVDALLKAGCPPRPYLTFTDGKWLLDGHEIGIVDAYDLWTAHALRWWLAFRDGKGHKINAQAYAEPFSGKYDAVATWRCVVDTDGMPGGYLSTGPQESVISAIIAARAAVKAHWGAK